MNVLMWSAALEKGYEPRLYPYAAEEVPTGEFEARLDFKIWAKRACTIHCYFTQVDTGKKFQLSVFKSHNRDVYGIETGCIDFHDCAYEVNYQIRVEVNEKGWPVLKKAVPCS
jgi:hypothetical protein